LATADAGQTVSLWSLPNGSQLGVFRGHTGAVTTIAFSSDATMLMTSGYDGTVRVWNVANGRELFSLIQQENAPIWIGFLPDDRLGLIRSSGHEVLIFDAAAR
jgi:WD40 repeat protein